MRGGRFLFTILIVFVISTPVVAQSTGSLTIEGIFGGDFSAPGPSQTRWTPSGDLSYFQPIEGGRELWLFTTATGEKRRLIGAEDLKRLAPSPSEFTEDQRERTRRTRFAVPDYHWSPDGQSLLLSSSGQIVLYDPAAAASRVLAPDRRGVLDPKFSPNGEKIAFVYQHDLWVVPTAGGEEKQVTFGGTDLILHGDLDWVYPEELGLRTGYHWSPDGRRIAFLELDETLVPIYPITEEVSRQASVDLQRYPKPGDPNPRVRLGVVDIDYDKTVWIDRAAEYIPRIDWVSPESVAVQLLNRGQDELELIYVNARTGRSTSVLAERDPYWLNLSNDLTFLEDGARFLWTSEESGFRHIYLHHGSGEQAGQRLRALTGGDWQVFGLEGVDEEKGLVYFSANRDNPIGRDLYRVRLDGTGLERITKQKGTHQISLSPSTRAYLDNFTSMTRPGKIFLNHTPTGTSTLFHEGASLSGLELVEPEWKLLDTEDGAKVGLLLMKPRELAPGKRYPVVVYVYGMPGSPTIRDSWGGTRYLFHQFLVQQGYVVAQIDDRSAAIWGKKYAVLGDHDIGPLAVKDHGVGVAYLRSLPYVDGERIGVWGWSGGGFTTTFHMTHTDYFKAGVAGAPVTDWYLYDSIYTERYMGTPEQDPEAYERTSSVKAAGSYRGRLLLIHGTHDDNVHPQNSIQLMQALIKNRKQFDVMFYPNKTHGVRGRDEVIHLWTMIFEFFERNLKS